MLAWLALSLTLAASPNPPSRRDNAPMLVTPAWLAAHLHDRNLVLLHVGEPQQYAQRHIPGARFADFHETLMANLPGSLTLEMPAADSLRARLERLGVSDDSRIVLYYGEDWISPTTRFYFTLRYAGLGDQTSVLDGGMGAWIRTGHAVTAELPAERTGRLAPLHLESMVVDAEFVRSHATAPGYDLVDARSAGFYDGVMEGGPRDAKRRGHIPGAKSLPFDRVVDDSAMFLTTDSLAALFHAAGVHPGDTVIGYCHIGQQATAMLFAARAIGYTVLLYDGSFEDWAKRDWPVELSNQSGTAP
jgi:thiosulfate/3-mercaptopyruvate sulfurtransferase